MLAENFYRVTGFGCNNRGREIDEVCVEAVLSRGEIDRRVRHC